LQVRQTYVASLPGQTAFDLLILVFGDFHTSFRSFYPRSITATQPFVLTRPKSGGNDARIQDYISSN
jgi:hypothetical protein